ncbi:unnamed protein product [Orchesella dallaii]|uniref:Uncharacterized protein n=1 Tax=Orchesella dallaii TaxID=48710 RepID=A0ABP1R2P8_9HEXA
MEGLSSELQYLDFDDLLSIGTIQEGYGLTSGKDGKNKVLKTSQKRKLKDIEEPVTVAPRPGINQIPLLQGYA